MVNDAPDGLFDTSEPAMSLRIARFKARVGQDPSEHAMMCLTLAVEDLDDALMLARSPEAHAAIRSTAEDAINRLMTIQTVSLTLERWDMQS